MFKTISCNIMTNMTIMSREKRGKKSISLLELQGGKERRLGRGVESAVGSRSQACLGALLQGLPGGQLLTINS
jgi:hypothetical protein